MTLAGPCINNIICLLFQSFVLCYIAGHANIVVDSLSHSFLPNLECHSINFNNLAVAQNTDDKLHKTLVTGNRVLF